MKMGTPKNNSTKPAAIAKIIMDRVPLSASISCGS
jgi:hypothetical protein